MKCTLEGKGRYENPNVRNGSDSGGLSYQTPMNIYSFTFSPEGSAPVSCPLLICVYTQVNPAAHSSACLTCYRYSESVLFESCFRALGKLDALRRTVKQFS